MTLHQWLSLLARSGRAADSSCRRANASRQNRSKRGARGILEHLEARDLFALDIVFNYTFDASNFFDTPAKKALLDLAATTFESRITDNLLAITPGGGNSWDLVINNPATGEQVSGDTNAPSLHNVNLPASTLIVYVGGHDLGGNTLGQGGFGGYNASGTQTFLDTIANRGQVGVGTTDYAPWGGSIAFDSVGTDWFFGTTTAGIGNGQSDFLSVAIHELGHVLGFGLSPSFHADRSGLSFVGSAAQTQYDVGSGGVPLADTGHWGEGVKDGGFDTSMDPTVTNGSRKTFTELDFAALVDLGWTLTNHTPVLDNSGSPTLTSINEDTSNNPGTLVSALLTGAGGSSLVTDADGFAMKGIAVTAVDNTNGAWQYTLNNGAEWKPFNTPSLTSARLLSSDPQTKIRFVPTPNFFGVPSGGISFKAWDQTSGNSGANGNSTLGGATSAFSANVEIATITINAVNDAPTNIQIAGATIPENSPNGTVVGTLTTVDADPLDTHTYFLNVDAQGRFGLNGNQLIVTNSALLNFEANASHNVQVRSTDPAGQTFVKNLTITITDQNEVVARRLFYNNSKFDGNNPGANVADDAATATDKVALLPGGTATFDNYTSYSRGINGVIIDIQDVVGNLTTADFQFRMGNDNNPAAWAAAPAPTSIIVRNGEGVGGGDRVELTWADGAIKKTWLQVTVKATAATGLPAADVFYFGNAVGEVGDAGNAVVNSTDEIQARNNPHSFLNPALVDNAFDFNRDGLVNATDQILARGNSTIAATALKWISVPAGLAGASANAPQLSVAAAPASARAMSQSASPGAVDAAAISTNVADPSVTTTAPAALTTSSEVVSAGETDDSDNRVPAGATAASAAAAALSTAPDASGSDGGKIVSASAAPSGPCTCPACLGLTTATATLAAAPGTAQGSTSAVDASLRAHLASRLRMVDNLIAQTLAGSSAAEDLHTDWMARVGQLRRRGR